MISHTKGHWSNHSSRFIFFKKAQMRVIDSYMDGGV